MQNYFNVIAELVNLSYSQAHHYPNPKKLACVCVKTLTIEDDCLEKFQISLGKGLWESLVTELSSRQ